MVQVPLLSSLACAAHLAGMATITGPNDDVSGWVHFQQNGHKMTVTGEIRGLAPNTEHGFHVHEYGDLSKGCDSTGAHYNPFAHDHGAPSDKNRHIGDLGNIKADEHGVAKIDIKDCLVRLCGEHNVMGRGVVVHADNDDLGKGGFPDSKTTGHAGARVGCGAIAYAPTLDLD